MHTPASSQVGADTCAAIRPSTRNLKPEWLRVSDAVSAFGMCRSSLYELIADGTLKSVSLRKRGAQRGIRLISFDSLADYVNRAAVGESGNANQ